MKKRIVLCIMAITLTALSFASCGDKDVVSSKAPQNNTKSSSELVGVVETVSMIETSSSADVSSDTSSVSSVNKGVTSSVAPSSTKPVQVKPSSTKPVSSKPKTSSVASKAPDKIVIVPSDKEPTDYADTAEEAVKNEELGFFKFNNKWYSFANFATLEQAKAILEPLGYVTQDMSEQGYTIMRVMMRTADYEIGFRYGKGEKFNDMYAILTNKSFSTLDFFQFSGNYLGCMVNDYIVGYDKIDEDDKTVVFERKNSSITSYIETTKDNVIHRFDIAVN